MVGGARLQGSGVVERQDQRVEIERQWRLRVTNGEKTFEQSEADGMYTVEESYFGDTALLDQAFGKPVASQRCCGC